LRLPAIMASSTATAKVEEGEEEAETGQRGGGSLLSPAVLDVIYGRRETVDGRLTKAEAYNRSLKTWWMEYR